MIVHAINEIHVLPRSIILGLYATHAGTLFVSFIFLLFISPAR